MNAGAQLQAFGSVATETIKPITDLAAFMGTTATEAANAFGRAYASGAGAADILREKGVLNIVKSFKGIEDLSKITLPEFREALIGALEAPSIGIAGSAERMSKTFTGAVSNMFDALGRLTASLADPFLPTLTSAVNKVTDFAKATKNLIAPNTITNFDMFGKKTSVVERELSMMTVKHLPTLREMLKKAEEESTRFQKSLDDQANAAQRSGDIFSGEYTLAINTGSQTQDNFFNKLKDGTLTIKEQTEQQANLTGSFLKITEAVEQQTDIQETTNNTTNRATELVPLLKEKIKELEEQEQKRNATLREEIQGQIQRNASIAGRLALQQQEIKLQEEQKETLSVFNNLFSQTDEGQRKNIETTLALMNANKELIISQNNISESDFNVVIDELNEKLGKSNTQSNSAAASLNVLSGALQSLRGGTKNANEMFAIFLRTVGSLVALSPGGASGGAVLSLLSSFIGHTGGLITNRGIQRFANGGMVQGQDNVPIMAQAGEFIMRREAVQNIGVQNLANMNRSGNAGNVTVNVSAPLVDDTVIDTIIPAINKAVNRNLA